MNHFSHSVGRGHRSFNRRRFLGTAAAAALLPFLPARNAWSAPARRVDPNSKVRLAICGIGNRGGDIGRWFHAKPEAEFVCACDVDLKGKHCARFLKEVPGLPLYTDFRKMFDKEAGNIDAVIVGTPDHTHFAITMQAMALGKHVYVEKPMAPTFRQTELMMRAAEKHGVVTQVGNQGHSEANHWQFKAWTEGGVIRDVRRVDAYMVAARRWHGWQVDGMPEAQPMPDGLDWDGWISTAPMTGFHSRLHPQNWRSWYDYGCGAFGDWGPHILDTTHRFLELGLPEEITAEKREGPNDFIFPQLSTVLFKFPARGGHPACEVRWFDGKGNRPQLPPEIPADTDMGSAGKIIYGGDLVFRGGSHGSTLRIQPEEKFREMRDSLPDYVKRAPDHASNFLLACRGEAEANAPFSVGGPLNQMFALGILAQRFGGTFRFDRESKKLTSHPEGEALLAGPPPRPEWEQYYRL